MNTHFGLVLLTLLFIHGSIGAPLANGQLAAADNQSDLVQQCHRALTYAEIQELLARSPCSPPLRLKRDDNTASTSNVYALQSTINDHRTIIDDHRKLIYYLMNNTVNMTQLDEHYAERHAKSMPIWRSWRDLSLLLLLFICLCAISGLLITRLHPVALLTSILIRRQNKKEKLARQENAASIAHKPKAPPLSTIAKEYMRYERDSNASL